MKRHKSNHGTRGHFPNKHQFIKPSRDEFPSLSHPVVARYDVICECQRVCVFVSVCKYVLVAEEGRLSPSPGNVKPFELMDHGAAVGIFRLTL